MRKDIELSDPNSCISKAKNDEEIFVLLGRDAAAAGAVAAWIELRIALGKNVRSDAKIRSAMEWIAKVRKEKA